jgi:hypothetical protein
MLFLGSFLLGTLSQAMALIQKNDAPLRSVTAAQPPPDADEAKDCLARLG